MVVVKIRVNPAQMVMVDFQQFAFENQVLHGRSVEQEVGNGRALVVFEI